MTDDEPKEPQPRRPRASVMLSAVVTELSGGEPTTHRVRDLGPGGIRIGQASALQVGTTVLISVGLLEAVQASVKWVREGSAGLAFAEEIDPERARMRVPTLSRPPLVAPARQPPTPPSAGWSAELRNPYRR